jgi:nucleoside-diphosphate-sugar epimerase
MNVLITGATGFIGKHLVKSLVNKKYKVRCLVRKSSNYKIFEDMDVDIWFGDLRNKKSLNGIINGIDVVFHLAGIGDINAISKKYYKQYKELNVYGTRNLLEQCINHRIKKFIHFSSVAAMGNLEQHIIKENDIGKPRTPYEKTKRESELIALKFWKKYKIPVIILRPTMVYGKDDKGEIKKIRKFVKLRIVPILGNGKNLIHMVHVDNVVQAAINAINRGKVGNTYIISGECYTWDELVDLISKKMGIKVLKLHIPFSVSKFIVSLIERIYNLLNLIPPFTLERFNNLNNNRMYDLSKARKELKYIPKIKLRT